MIIVTLPSLYLFMAGKNLLVELETAKLGRKKKKKRYTNRQKVSCIPFTVPLRNTILQMTAGHALHSCTRTQAAPQAVTLTHSEKMHKNPSGAELSAVVRVFCIHAKPLGPKRMALLRKKAGSGSTEFPKVFESEVGGGECTNNSHSI